MTTQQIIENELRVEQLKQFAEHLKAAATRDSRLKTDSFVGHTAGALICGNRVFSFNSDGTNMGIYFYNQGERPAPGSYPDQVIRAVMHGGAMCWEDESGTKYSSEELAQHFSSSLLSAA